MRYVKWVFVTLLLLLIFSVGHYTLPQHDIARIVDAEVRRIDFGDNSLFWAIPDTATAQNSNRDVRFIDTVMNNDKFMVYRNEDTGFSWPFYFKFDSSNLGAQARDLRSTVENPKWVSITHYGWRNEFLSIYPNAITIKSVSGPDVRIIPWFNIFFLIFMALICLGIFRLLQKFKRRRVDPVLDNIEEAFDDFGDSASDARDQASGFGKRAKGWVGGLFGRK